MSDISSVGHNPIGPPHRSESLSSPDRNGVHASTTSGEGRSDRVELSQYARWLDQLRNLPEVRTEKIEMLRESIREGAYESESKLDTTIERMLSDLES